MGAMWHSKRELYWNAYFNTGKTSHDTHMDSCAFCLKARVCEGNPDCTGFSATIARKEGEDGLVRALGVHTVYCSSHSTLYDGWHPCGSLVTHIVEYASETP